MYECDFCSKTFSNAGGRSAHRKFCGLNPDKAIFVRPVNAGFKKGNSPWNKGLTKETDERVKLRGENLKQGFKSGKLVHVGKPHSDKVRKVLSRKAFERKQGGYKQGSGRGKKGWYKGFFCDSSWELAFIIYHLEHDIPIERNSERLKYIWENKERNYLPDFIINGNVVEIKGYKSPQSEAKKLANPHVKILYEEDLKYVFDYVINKYGKNFVTLYEDRKGV